MSQAFVVGGVSSLATGSSSTAKGLRRPPPSTQAMQRPFRRLESLREGVEDVVHGTSALPPALTADQLRHVLHALRQRYGLPDNLPPLSGEGVGASPALPSLPPPPARIAALVGSTSTDEYANHPVHTSSSPSPSSLYATEKDFLRLHGCPTPSRVESVFAAGGVHSALGKMLTWFSQAVVRLFTDGVEAVVDFPTEWDSALQADEADSRALRAVHFELQGFSTLFTFLWAQMASADLYTQSRYSADSGGGEAKGELPPHTTTQSSADGVEKSAGLTSTTVSKEAPGAHVSPSAASVATTTAGAPPRPAHHTSNSVTDTNGVDERAAQSSHGPQPSPPSQGGVQAESAGTHPSAAQSSSRSLGRIPVRVLQWGEEVDKPSSRMSEAVGAGGSRQRLTAAQAASSHSQRAGTGSLPRQTPVMTPAAMSSLTGVTGQGPSAAPSAQSPSFTLSGVMLDYPHRTVSEPTASLMTSKTGGEGSGDGGGGAVAPQLRRGYTIGFTGSSSNTGVHGEGGILPPHGLIPSSTSTHQPDASAADGLVLISSTSEAARSLEEAPKVPRLPRGLHHPRLQTRLQTRLSEKAAASTPPHAAVMHKGVAAPIVSAASVDEMERRVRAKELKKELGVRHVHSYAAERDAVDYMRHLDELREETLGAESDDNISDEDAT